MSEKSKRPGSHMGDDERARQPRPALWVPPEPASGEIEIPSPLDDFETVTPPPIVVDDIGRQVSRTAPPVYAGRMRQRKTIQEIAEELWPARRAMDLVLDHMERIVKLETRVEELVDNGPAAVAAASVAALRGELMGADGDGGAIGALANTVARDLDDAKKAMALVEVRATKADKFVRRCLYAAGGLIGGSLIGAAVMIYAAGQASVRGEAKLNDIRTDLIHRAETVDRGLTELQGQVKLLLETSLGRKP